ncbi:hypothetical protein LTR51_000244 [Lithohypha guttulata]|nr:hypothetical protein LTR51_000244 [Lithohypha guttulata]
MPAAKEQNRQLTTEKQPALDLASLPPIDSLVLDSCSEIEWEQTCRLNAAEWKGFLSYSDYLNRERILANTEITREGGGTAWILTCDKLPRAPDGSRAILASCETNRKNAYVAKDGKLEKVVAHGIGSVYTRSEYRGKGYAAKMLQEIGRKLNSYQQVKNNRGHFSVLYSDIGPKFYARHGWNPFASTHICLQAIDNQGEYYQRLAEITPRRETKDLTIDDVHSLAPSWAAHLESQLINLSATNPSKAYVAFKPEPAQFEWHFMREEFLAENLGNNKPVVKGAIDTKTGTAVVWARTYGSDSAQWHLSVLYTHIPTDADLAQDELRTALSTLMLRAQWEAKQWNMAAGVEIWDPKELVVAAAQTIAHGQDVKIILRDQEHICSLRWNGPETDEVVWVANERFAWC